MLNPRHLLPAGVVLAASLLLGCETAVIEYGPRPAPPPAVVVRDGPPPWAPAHGYRDKHRYRYYYREQVYYCLDTGQWCWLEGSDWRVGVQLPPHLRVSTNFVVVELEGPRPFVYHPQVVAVYPPAYVPVVVSPPPARGRGLPPPAPAPRGRGRGR